ncbi:PINc domain-containing protein [Mycena venus]|uniref:PINc domain-containing protein n=1 Tax=Mycena venus TaxID=2733690 RepID=A0A8H6XVG2_9AGAR|nr:PINc domain-containing protein [Mycena venus]
MPIQILIYEALIFCLKEACTVGVPGRSPSEITRVRVTLDEYLLSMVSSDIVNGIIKSLECRKTLLELASDLGLANDLRLRTALRKDEERIATFLLSILTSKSAEEAVLRLEGDPAQCFLDVVQSTLDKGFLIAREHSRMAHRIIRKLSTSCDRLPSSLFITGVTGKEERPTFGGGFGDIYRASYGNRIVALKYMRAVQYMRGSDLRCIRLKFCREALVWKELHHPHILPFLGIEDSFPSSLCMVSPWMEHGTVLAYLKGHGHTHVDKLLYEVAQGLQYLHSCHIVHGDLRGANILINEDWSACLADFGLSIFSDTTSSMTTSRVGSLYWMAPELIYPDRFGLKFAQTPASDVYAFACVCFELYTGRPPFSNMPEPAAMMKVINGERPERPSGSPAMSDILWQHVSAYWAQEPVTRPPTQIVVKNMVWPPESPPAGFRTQHSPHTSSFGDLPGPPAISNVPVSSKSNVVSPVQDLSATSATAPSSVAINRESNAVDDDRSITAFAIQLKKLYRAITYLETKIKQEDLAETHNAGDAGAEGDQEREKWKRRIENHNELADNIHKFLEICLTSGVPASLRDMPTKYNMITRLWTFGFLALLESLRRVSFTSAVALEHLHHSIYYAYSFYTTLLEKPILNPFKCAWLEALGDLARYKVAATAMFVGGSYSGMAVSAAGIPVDSTSLLELPASAVSERVSDTSTACIEGSQSPSIDTTTRPLDVEPEKERWRCVSRNWYGEAIADQPNHGRLHHHLGLLSRDVACEELRAVYHFCKSMTTLHPFSASRESVLPLWSVTAQVRRALPEATTIDLFLLLHGMLFTNIHLDEFEPTLERFIERLEIDGADEREWIMMAVVNICAVLEYGNPDGVLKKARAVDILPGYRAIMARRAAAAPAMSEPGPAPFHFASQLMFAMLRHVLQRSLNPYTTVVLTFLATVLKHPQMLSAMERRVPWGDLATFFTSIPRHIMASQGLMEPRTSRKRWPSLTAGCVPLPEDWCLRGMEWVEKVYQQGFWKTAEGRHTETEVLDSIVAGTFKVDDAELARRSVRVVRCAVGIADVVNCFTWVEGTQQWRVESALAKKAEAWKEQDRLRTREGERKWMDIRLADDFTDVDEDSEDDTASEESEDREDEVVDRAYNPQPSTPSTFASSPARRIHLEDILECLLSSNKRTAAPVSRPRRSRSLDLACAFPL